MAALVLRLRDFVVGQQKGPGKPGPKIAGWTGLVYERSEWLATRGSSRSERKSGVDSGGFLLADSKKPRKIGALSGGMDGTRTRGLLRDRQTL